MVVHQEKRKSGKLIHFKIYRITQQKLIELIDTVIPFGICLVVFAMPLLFAEFSRIILLFSASAILIPLFLIRLLLASRQGLSQNKITKYLMFFLITYVIASIFSLSPIVSIVGHTSNSSQSLIAITCFIALAIIASSYFGDESNKTYFKWSFMLSGLLVAGFGITTFLITQDPKFIENNRLTSTLSNPTVTALFLSAVFSIAIFQFKKADTLFEKIVLSIISAVVCTAILLTYSLVSWIALIVIISTFVYTCFFVQKFSKAKIYYLIPIIILIASILFTVIFPISREKFSQNLGQDAMETITSKTKQELDAYFKIFIRRPITGTGPDLAYTQMYQVTNSKSLAESSSNSAFLTLITSSGLLGIIPLLILILLTVRDLITKKLKARFPEYLPLIIVLIFMLFFAELTSITMIIAIFIISIMTNGFEGINFRRQVPSKTAQIIGIVAAIAAIPFFAVSIVNVANAAQLFQQAQTEETGIAIQTLSKAIDSNPYNTEYRIVKAEQLTNFAVNKNDITNFGETLRLMLEEMRYAIGINPHDYLPYRQTANFLFQIYQKFKGEDIFESAVSYQKQATKLAPLNAELWSELAQIYERNAQEKLAHDAYAKAIAADPTNWMYYLNDALMLKKIGNKNDAKKLLDVVESQSKDSYYISIATLLKKDL